MRKRKENTTVIYQTKSGAIDLRGDVSHETIWATQADIAEMGGAVDAESALVVSLIRG